MPFLRFKNSLAACSITSQAGPMFVDGHLLDVRDDVLVHHRQELDRVRDRKHAASAAKRINLALRLRAHYPFLS
jgi:hypothetical protein